MVPQPCLAVLLLFPITTESEAAKAAGMCEWSGPRLDCFVNAHAECDSRRGDAVAGGWSQGAPGPILHAADNLQCMRYSKKLLAQLTCMDAPLNMACPCRHHRSTACHWQSPRPPSDE